MSLTVVLGVGAVIIAGAGGGLTLFLSGRARQRAVSRRLRRVAAPLTGRTVAPDRASAPEPEEVIIVQTRARQGGIWDKIEARCPLIHLPSTLPKALGLGLLGGAAAVAALWFVRVPFGWWTLPSFAVAAVAATMLAFSWFQRRALDQFLAKFPEAVDHTVRLSATGVPVFEAVASVVEEAPHPVKPVLGMFADQLLAGIDPDDAARATSHRFRIPELTMFMAVIRLQRRSGGAVAAAFSNLSVTLRERRQASLKAKASTAQTRFTLLILTVLPAILLAVQQYTSPEAIDILFNTESGVQLLRWGLALIAFGIYIARAIAASAAR